MGILPTVATLRSLTDRVEQPVSSRFLVGRSPSCALTLDEKFVSGEHATITWTGRHWEIRDLGSRNGTYLDGARLEPGKGVKLHVGAGIAFGDPERVWELLDDSGPTALAIDLESGAMIPAEDGLLALPSADAPTLSIYPDASGTWAMETNDGDLKTLRDQEIVMDGPHKWRIQLPFVAEGTPLMDVELAFEGISLRFSVSRDEETVRITIVSRGRELELEAREHCYVLLILARARQEDETKASHERGWRSRAQLQKMLRMDSNALNVAIHRARQQLLAAGVDGAAGIVEVRRGMRRLGTDRFSIVSAS